MSTSQIISQELLIEKVLPEIKKSHQQYFKFQQILARKAELGERVKTVTSSGLETINVAKTSNNYVVKNNTSANEQYLISEEKFLKLYSLNKNIDSVWSLYNPLGSVLAIEVTENLIKALGVNATFKIMAPWGTEQSVKLNDMLVSSLPLLNQVYGIGKKEFDETYNKA